MATSDTIVRDRKDYPTPEAARASLPNRYANHPYVGLWLQPGDPEEYVMYVFSTRLEADFLDDGWQKREYVPDLEPEVQEVPPEINVGPGKPGKPEKPKR